MKNYKIIFLSFVFGLLFWIGDGILDYLIFYNISLLDILILKVPIHEIYIRLLNMLIFLLFGFIFYGSTKKRVLSEIKLKKLNRSMKVLTQCDEKLVRAENEIQLLDNICSIIHEIGGYPIVWVGYPQYDESKRLIPIAYKGFDSEFANKTWITWNSGEQFSGPSSIIFKTKKVQIFKNIQNTEIFSSWKREIERFGINSAISFPLLFNEEVIGVLNIYSKDADAFDDDEVELLKDLSEDMAYGIASLRVREKNELQEEELKNSEFQLKKSDENLRATLNGIGDGVIATDEFGIVSGMNPVAEMLTGWRESDAVGKSLNEVFVIVNAITGKPAFNPVDRVLKEGKIIGLANHTVLISKDGMEYQIADSASPIKTKEGKIIGVVLIFRDVTEKYIRDRALFDSEDRLKRAQAVAKVGSWELDIRSKRFWGSEEAFRILGIKSYSTYISIDELKLVIPEDEHIVNRALDNLIRRNAEYNIEYRINKADSGETRYIHSVAALTCSDSGQPLKIIGTIQDISLRKLAEKMLQEQTEMFKQVTENIKEVFWLRENNKFLYITPAFEEIWERRREDLYENPDSILDTIYHEDKAVISKYFDEGKEKYGSYDIKFRIVRPEGEIRWIWLRGNPVKDNYGKIYRYACVAQDITYRKLAEEALIESEEKFRLISEQSLMGIIIVQQGQVKYINEAYADMIEIPIDDIIHWKASNLAKFIHPEDRDFVVEQSIKKQSGEPDTVERIIYRGISSSGRIGWVEEFSKTIIFDDKPAQLIMVMEITDRKNAEENIKLQKEISLELASIGDLNKALNIILEVGCRYDDIDSGGVYLFDYENDIIELMVHHGLTEKYVNSVKRFSLDSPITKVAMQGKSIFKSYHEFSSLIIDLLELEGIKSLATIPISYKGKIVSAINFASHTAYTIPEKTCFALEAIVAPIGGIIARIKAEEELKVLNNELEQRVKNRTAELADALEELKYENDERRRTAEQLLKAKEDLSRALSKEKELNELKTRFITMVSHEYRTPLTVILSSTYLLNKHFIAQNSEKFNKHISKIIHSVDSMTELLEDVLIIGKSDSGKLEYNPIRIDLIEHIGDIIESVKVVDQERHLFDFSSNVKYCFIDMDEKTFHHIISNLLSNAAKYSPEATPIIIELFDNENDININIIDKGIGIPQEDNKMIFEPFHRSKNTGRISGTGLGLAIVKRCMDNIKGRISYISKLNEGTTFTITIMK